MNERTVSWEDEERRQIRRLRVLSFIEGTTLLALVLIAVPAKHLFGLPVATRVVGPIHGMAFLAYCWALVATVSGGGWAAREVARLALAGFVPFGALTVAGLLRRREVEVGVRSSRS